MDDGDHDGASDDGGAFGGPRARAARRDGRVKLEPNAVVAGRYVLDRLLGEGGVGVVWAATHRLTRRHVALKFLKEQRLNEPNAVARFVREARAASAIEHPNVVRVIDVLELEGNEPVMVMELLAGESMRERLVRAPKIPLGELADIVLPVVSAVGTAHALGIVHRDLKPDNIFLARAHDGSVDVKVLDFGIAKLAPTDADHATGALTATGSLVGTPQYMAPEQVFGEKDVDHRTDVWALGVLLYEALSGVRPTHGTNVGQILKSITTGTFVPLASRAPEVPAEIADLVMRMLERARDARPHDLREVHAVLKRYGSRVVPSFGEPAVPFTSADLPPLEARAIGAETRGPSSGGTLASAPTPTHLDTRDVDDDARARPAQAARSSVSATPGALTRGPSRASPRLRTAGVAALAAIVAAGGVVFVTSRAPREREIGPDAAPETALAARTAAPPVTSSSAPSTPSPGDASPISESRAPLPVTPSSPRPHEAAPSSPRPHDTAQPPPRRRVADGGAARDAATPRPSETAPTPGGIVDLPPF